MIEVTGPKHRQDFLLYAGFGWIIGYCSLPWIALWIGHFRYLTLVNAFLGIITGLWLYFYIDESARWQLVNNKFDKVEKTIKKILNKNNKLTSEEDLKEKMKQLKEHIQLVIKSSYFL